MIALSPLSRTFPLLSALMLIPLGAFALIALTEQQAKQEADVRATLARQAQEYADGVVARMDLAAAALEITLSRAAEGDPSRVVNAEKSAPYFSSITRIDAQAHAGNTSSIDAQVPPLSGAARNKLDAYGPVIVVREAALGAAQVLMLSRPPRHAEDQRVAVAALKPEFLWGKRSDPNTGDVRVLGSGGLVLYASAAAQGNLAPHFDPARSLTLSGAFAWADANGRYMASYRSVPVEKHFAFPDWTLIASRPEPSVLRDASVASGLAVALGLALFAAAWVCRSARWQRAGAGTKHGHGELHRGALVVQTKTAQRSAPRALGPDLGALAGFAEMDRAILAHASIDRILEIAMRQAAAVLDCDLVAVSCLQPEIPNRARTLSSVAGGALTSGDDELPAPLAAMLTRHPNGRWVDDPRSYPFLGRLAATGARRFLLLPVFRDGRLAAILCLGRSQSRLGDDVLARAQPFATRIGVALTASARAEEAHFLQRFESMTGLPNRRHFRERLSQEISRAKRANSQLALLYVDLDQFKRVNDGAGHEVGDAVLKEAAARLRFNLREEDVLAHFGGDEFVLLTQGIAGAADAGRIADKLITLLSEPFCVEDGAHHLSASIGIGVFPNDGRSADALLQNTDSALSRAKKAGRSQYVFFEERINDQLREQFAIELELRRALAHNEFVLFYQPQLDVRSGKLVGAEALIRWQHPKRGLLPPAAFIEIAEDCGLIEQIGEYTRRLACAQYRAWEAHGVAVERVSVNVSGRELGRKDFIPRLEATLTEAGIRPFALEIEITERTLVDDTDEVMTTLKALRERGIRIAIDDFGTGYSSLSYLKRMPFDMLKVDRSFVSDIGGAGEAESCAVASAVLGIAHSLGKEVCAEGVETEQQRVYLAERGCELVQGYLISRPLPTDEFERFVRNWQPAIASLSGQPEDRVQTLAA